ncbi:MAG: hypothetical protein HFH26_07500 [Clostridiaceae bacterium]|nr:hypothetical protein [Clostridiaceae bacterium]
MEFQQIFNVRDLLLVLFLVISGLLGASHGLIRTFMSLLGRLVSIFGAGFAAKLLAPVIARIVVTPIIGDLFERDAASYLAALPIPIEITITEMAVEMAEGVAFLLLMILFGILFSLMLSIVSQSLRFLTRYTPLGILDRLAGLALGAAGGAALLMLAAVVLSYAAPELFRDLGWLSPVNTADTLLTREFLAALIPDYAV